MSILYVDIDGLWVDPLGCYGCHRATSPAIDRRAAEGVRFENVCVSDAPRLSSRTPAPAGPPGPPRRSSLNPTPHPHGRPTTR